MSTHQNNNQEVKSSIYRNRDGNYSNNQEDADDYMIFEIYIQQSKVNTVIEENKKLKKHIKKIENSEESEQENSNKNSEENLQSPELPNNSNNLSNSQSQINSDMEIKNIYKTLFYWALDFIVVSTFVAWWFYKERNFYITLIERENVHIVREGEIIDTFVESLKKLKRNKIDI
ncbi:7961_t:CDS:2 [Scutellospora calospora]|uniref:7961_t:CDS:1 n=1 Tax=Scutellospora calospora TaxID=85575 RepID=A0ACA9LSN5_9GLOM|nr:7961_t:CDS:2 [Scutellospora calospora]